MNRERLCCVCQRPFIPHPRVKDRQKVCTAKACRTEWKRRGNWAWREQNPDYFKGRYDIMLKDWYKINPDYKKQYRLRKKTTRSPER
jgi:hypothetical protein